MVAFRINLIRDSALPPESRRAVFWAMFVYLAVWGALLTAVAYGGTKLLVDLRKQRLDASVAEISFRAAHPGASDIAAYGRDTSAQLQRAVDRLEALNRLHAQCPDLPRVLLALAAPLPGDVNIVSFEMDRGKSTVVFDLALPVGEAGESIDVSRLIAVWNSDTALSAQLRRISSLRSQRQKVDGKTIETWRFTATTEGGGS